MRNKNIPRGFPTHFHSDGQDQRIEGGGRENTCKTFDGYRRSSSTAFTLLVKQLSKRHERSLEAEFLPKGEGAKVENREDVERF